MFLAIHRPRPPLDGFVESIVFYEGLETPHRREKLLPDGTLYICVDLGETPKQRYDSAGRCTAFRKAWVSGAQDCWMAIEAQQGSSMLVIAFLPGGAWPFLRFPVGDLTNQVVPLEDALAAAGVSLRQRVLEAAGPAARFAAAETWLMERAGQAPRADPLVGHVLARLGGPGCVRVAEVAAETGYSQRHVAQLFRHHVGVSPKSFQRLSRFARVRRLLAELEMHRRRPDWPDLSAAFGYADQSHLIRDFRDFAGLTPTGYAEAAQGIDNFIPLPDV